MFVFLKDNTLLGQEHTEQIVGHYLLYLEEDNSKRIERGGDKGQLDWSAISLRQTTGGELTNRLYMKLEMKGNRGGEVSRVVSSMSLM